MKSFFNFSANNFYHVQSDTRVHWYIPSRRTPQMLNVNKSLEVYPAGLHLKFI